MLDDPVVDINKRLDRSALPVQWISDIEPHLSNAWLIKGLLPQEGIALIYGPSGSGKTFLTLDIAAHVAAGLPWGERKTRQGVVAYIAAESPASLANRAALWRERRAPDQSMPFGIIPRTMNLCDRHEDLQQLIEWLRLIESERGPIAAVFVDTLARSMGGGDENLARDMGAIVTSCDALREAFKTLVVLVHHTGKNAEAGARGSYALKCGIDTEIEVSDDHGDHQATWRKQRDGEEGFHYRFRLEAFPLGEDEDGEPVTSCLVTDLEFSDEKPTRKQTRISPAQKIALDALHELLDHGTIASREAMKAGARVGQTVASLKEWRQLCYDRDVSGGEQGAKQKAFKRAAEWLKAKHKVQVYQDEVWLAD